ncbi:MAG: Uma2 family endonuclease [Candidatus Competibacter sp.]|nr:Uma2 family endonuclease [Candidatus Competibacter sp.]MDG4605664.1 Uma2 family endonuclease [Candidatus Contendobacter sp.]HRD50429.1 Uma2 family endonuclease [Candidatus Contendobacter sp.]
MTWQAICDNPLFRDMPFKFETNRWGRIEMSPASNRHSRYQGLIAKLLDRLLADGEAIPECSIQTADGVKVADVAWASADFLRRHGVANPYPEAPEIVIEILSPSNTLAEMEEKKELYFARGAREFWICQEDGLMRFYNNHAQLMASALAPGFPARVELTFA